METITQEEWISRKISWHPDGYGINKSIQSLCGKFHVNKSVAQHILAVAANKGWVLICPSTGEDFYPAMEFESHMKQSNIIPF